VIYTEYDLPRQTIQPHDVVVDEQGIAWYSSFGEQNLGRLDPKTGKVREYPIEMAKPGFPTGLLGLRQDREGNLWMGNMYQARIVKFDRKTQKFTAWKLPPERDIDAAQINMVSPQSSHVDGKVWTQAQRLRRRAPARPCHGQKVETGSRSRRAAGRTAQHLRRGPQIRRTTCSSPISASATSAASTRTGEVKLFEMPSAARVTAPRRGTMDAQDRLWFGQYRGDRIGMLDTRTGQFRDWQVGPRWSAPYDVIVDRNEEAWTGSMVTDRVTRLDTRTGGMVDYLLPRQTNIRRVYVDNSTNPVTFWVGSNHGASIVKLEPLD
jgi:streptogramin lyase